MNLLELVIQNAGESYYWFLYVGGLSGSASDREARKKKKSLVHRARTVRSRCRKASFFRKDSKPKLHSSR